MYKEKELKKLKVNDAKTEANETENETEKKEYTGLNFLFDE